MSTTTRDPIRQRPPAATEALRAVRRGRAKTLRERYFELLLRLREEGVVYFPLGSTTHEVTGGFTDHEAAHLLGCLHTSVQPRRAELNQGGTDVVVERGRRTSLVKTSNYENTIYALHPAWDPFTDD